MRRVLTYHAVSAQGGLKFNNFHTTALCSPSRNALKTGRNHHTVNTGDQRRLFARQAEVFAGFLEHTDAEIGRP